MIRFAVRGIAGRKLRTALTAIAVVLGVAMVSGTFVLTDSIDKAFDAIFSEVYSGTDATITGKTPFDVTDGQGSVVPAFPESVTADVLALPTVADAIGGVGGDAQLIGDNGKAIVFGGAPNLGFSVDPTKPEFNTLTLESGAWPGADEVVIDVSTASKKHLEPGDEIGVQAQGPVQKMTISGLVKFGSVDTIGGATLAGFDLRTAQALFDKEGKLDQIRVAAKTGVSPAELVADIKTVLPPGTQVRTGAEQATEDAKDTDEFISFLRYFLLAFGVIALFVGAFVIVNSLSITIAQRTRELATLRTLGASRRQVRFLVVIEALVMGVIASVIGLFLGLALAMGLFKLFEAVGFTLPNSGLLLTPRTVIVALSLGILVTLIASIFPAMRATRVPPIAAVREGATIPAGRFARFRIPTAVLLTADRLRGPRLGALRSRPRHDQGAPVHDPRDVADLHRRRDALDAVHSRTGAGAGTAGTLDPGCVHRPRLALLAAPVLAAPARRLGPGGSRAAHRVLRSRSAPQPAVAHPGARHVGAPCSELVGARVADRVPGRPPRQGDRDDGNGQCPPQPAADCLDGGGADDRPGSRDARRHPRRRDHPDVPWRRQRPLHRGLRDHGPEQLLADPDRGRRGGHQDAGCDRRRQRPERRRSRVRQVVLRDGGRPGREGRSQAHLEGRLPGRPRHAR